jgi:hypothetical protein
MDSDEALVRRVNSTKCYYAILTVPRTASVDEIKSAYKKLALRLHPDKNKLPRAEDAFKQVGRAYGTLSDPQKREVYDRHGEDGVQAHESGGRPGAQGNYARRGGGGFRNDEDVLFQMFEEMFGRHHFTRPQQAPQRNGAQASFIYQVLPVLLLFFVYFLSSGSMLNESAPSFSLNQEKGYTQARTTKTLGSIKIKYFVEPNFGRKYGGDGYVLRQIEHEVLKNQMHHLERLCVFEQLESLQEDLKDETRFLKEAQEEEDIANLRKHKKRVDEMKGDIERLRSATGSEGGLFSAWRQKDMQRAALYKSVVRQKCGSCQQLDTLRKQAYGG